MWPYWLLPALVLGGCSTVDEWVFGADPEPSARPLEVTPLEAGEPYPPVASVPPRPQLSYTVEQEREIVDALISDRENARYTGDVVRYRSGLGEPPAATPPAGFGGRLLSEQVVGEPGRATTPLLPSTSERELSGLDEGTRTMAPESSEFDDGGLDDFVRGLVDETSAEPGLGSEAAVIDQRQERAAIPGRKGEESAFERLFLWIGRQFGIGGDDQTPDEAGAQAAEGAAVVAPRHADQVPERAVPARKPAESADPPEPAPAKPDRANGQARGPDQSAAAVA